MRAVHTGLAEVARFTGSGSAGAEASRFCVPANPSEPAQFLSRTTESGATAWQVPAAWEPRPTHCSFQQVVLHQVAHELRVRLHAQLAHHARAERADGLHAQAELLRDVTHAVACTELLHDLELTA